MSACEGAWCNYKKCAKYMLRAMCKLSVYVYVCFQCMCVFSVCAYTHRHLICPALHRKPA